MTPQLPSLMVPFVTTEVKVVHVLLVGDIVARRDTDVHVANGADDWGHLHVPIDKGLSLVGDNVVCTTAVVTLLMLDSGFVTLGKVGDIDIATDPFWVKLGSTNLDTLGLELGKIHVFLNNIG
ncbi:hypothetical protein HG531_007177 [Fusarium graminearum]|nr:hypothetical protein HG531_007177 [Fusarium graminearum]